MRSLIVAYPDDVQLQLTKCSSLVHCHHHHHYLFPHTRTHTQ